MQHRIPLVNLAGALISSIPVTLIPVSRTPATIQVPAHFILVLDRSGSMYGAMAEMASTVIKNLTLAEYRDSDLSVSVISYSSVGDFTVHFKHVRVCDIMAPNSREQAEIRKLEATFLTCISQGLQAARDLIRDGETTVIALHTDGYANDSSPYTERQKLEVLATEVAKKGAILNTVAYGWADFPLLDRLASLGGGKATAARNAKEVFDAFQASMATAAGNVAPATRVSAAGKQLMAISRSANKVMTGRDEILIRGLTAKDDLIVASIGDTEEGGTLPSDHNIDRDSLAIALSRTFLSEGKINEAKMLVLGARAKGLYPHLRALSAADLGNFAEALDQTIASGLLETSDEWGVRAAGASIMEVLEVLRQHLDGFEVHLPTLRDGYSKRSERREEGVWENDQITRPRFKTASKDPNAEWFRATSIDQNQSGATINIKLAYGINLVGRDNNEVVGEVQGIKLDRLSNFRAYTLVGDGSANTPNFRIRVTDKRLTRALERLGYDGGNDITFPFNKMNVIPLSQVGSELVADSDIVSKLVGVKTAIGLLSAATAGTSTKYDATKMAALKEHYLSGELYISFPTTTPWRNDEERKEWIRTGKLDSYTTYSIGVGTTEMPVIDLRSGNDLLKTFAMRTEDEGKKKKDIKDPKMPEIFTTTFKASGKEAEKAQDKMQKPWLDQLLGLSNTGPWEFLLEQAGVETEDVERFLEWRKITKQDDKIELFTDIKRKLEKYQALLFAQVMSPTVLYMGSTGFLPDGIKATTMTAEQVVAKYGVKLGKAEMQATYYLLEDGKRLLSVMPEVAWFTREPATQTAA